METIDEFRKNLKDLMNEKNLNFTQLGKEIGLNPRTIRRWYEDRFPKVNSVVKISDYFGCSCDFLFGMTEIFEFQSSKKPVSFYSRYIELAEKKALRMTFFTIRGTLIHGLCCHLCPISIPTRNSTRFLELRRI